MFELFQDAVKESDKKTQDLEVLILGYAYDANSDDDRNTPTLFLMKELDKVGVKYTVHDSFIKEYKKDLKGSLKGKDVIILMTAHDEYKNLDYKEMKDLMNSSPIIIDGRNVFDKEEARKNGFIYKGVGNI